MSGRGQGSGVSWPGQGAGVGWQRRTVDERGTPLAGRARSYCHSFLTRGCARRLLIPPRPRRLLLLDCRGDGRRCDATRSAATTIAMAYRSAVAKSSAKFQAASQLPGDMRSVWVSGKARGSRRATRVPRDEDGGDVGSMSGRRQRNRNARSGADGGCSVTRSISHPFKLCLGTAPCWQLNVLSLPVASGPRLLDVL